MKLFRIEKNTSNLELKKFKKGYYKIVLTNNDITELEVFCKIDKKTSDYFYFKVEDKNIPTFEKLEELKLGYFVIPEQPDMAVVEVQPEQTITEFNNQPKQEEQTMATVTYTTKDLESINKDVLEVVNEKGINHEQLIQSVNNLPESFQPQIDQAVQLGLTDLEARIRVAIVAIEVWDFMGLSTPTNNNGTTKEEDTTREESVKNDGDASAAADPEPQVKPESKPESQAKPQTKTEPKSESNSGSSVIKTVAKTTAGIVLGAGIAYGLYKLAKEYF